VARSWLQALSRPKCLTITCDGGSNNGSRVRLRKRKLQVLANELGTDITVHHLPPATSQWNKIEHRLFSFINTNWRVKPPPSPKPDEPEPKGKTDPSAVRAILDDLPIRIRPIGPSISGCKAKEPFRFRSLRHRKGGTSASRLQRIFCRECQESGDKGLTESYIYGTIRQAPAGQDGVEPDQPPRRATIQPYQTSRFSSCGFRNFSVCPSRLALNVSDGTANTRLIIRAVACQSHSYTRADKAIRSSCSNRRFGRHDGPMLTRSTHCIADR
jgi:hypothetical protein